MSKPIVFMFSGQGSQSYQMGKELWDHHHVFRKWMLKQDDIVEEMIGRSIIEIIYSSFKQRKDRFDQTLYTHPAIFMVEYSLARVFIEQGINPAFVMGTSLGEFASAAVADVMPLEKTIEAVIVQARMLEECEDGGMIAVVENKRLFDEMPVFKKNSQLAAVNFESHFVVAGQRRGIAEIESELIKKEKLYEVLSVSKGFHSAYIDSAKKPYVDYLSTIDISRPSISFVSCDSGEQISSISKDYFWNVIRHAIQFNNAVLNMEKKGPFRYLDLGPSGILATFAKRIIGNQSESEIYSVMNPFGVEMEDLEQLERVLRKSSRDLLKK